MKILKIVIFFIVIFFLLKLVSSTFLSDKTTSPDQDKSIELLGNPSQFVLTYLPQQAESGQQLARFETWYYPSPQKKLTFLSGKLIDSQDFVFDQDISELQHFPWDFDIHTSPGDLVKLFGQDNLILVDLPSFSEDGLKTYTTDSFMFVFEDDYLTYVQTFFVDDTPLPTTIPEESFQDLSQLKTYTNSDLGFSINYPDTWFLESGVLSNYETNYMMRGGLLPPNIIKCDFIKYDESSLFLEDLNQISSEAVNIYQTKVVEETASEGMGYGDNVVYLFQDDIHQRVALVCFAHASSLQPDLISFLKTFKFLD